MSKITKEKKERLGFTAKTRPLSREEWLEIQQLHLIVTTEQFKLAQMQGNSALFPRKDFVTDQETLTKLLSDAEQNWFREIIPKLGYPAGTQVAFDFVTGQFTVI